MYRVVLVPAVTITATLASSPATADTGHVEGIGVFDSTCPDPPAGYAGFTDYPPIRLTGSLEGCWYTNVETVKDNGAPSGVYLETGHEVFVGSVDGGPDGVFETTYKFESKWRPDVSSGVEVHGRCQHPIVGGSGTGGFAGVAGRIDFKDVVEDGTYVYRGHLHLG